MESRLANEARRALVAATQKLTPEQRVEAFLVHCRLLAELRGAGAALKFIGREDFIAMKAFAGGPLDMQDASQAIEAAGQSLDVGLLRRIVAGYGREAAMKLEALLGGDRAIATE